jgi:hypothetical protein
MARRGRPQKFGRPSQLVALTLPRDVLDSLRALHQDVAWAIVQLVESKFDHGHNRRRPKALSAIAELVHLPGRRGLIVVQPKAFARLRGVSTIPFADGRAFLAFDQAAGLADLEVAVGDKLERKAIRSAERARLMQILEAVRGWRRDPDLVFRTKSIIVVESRAHVEQGSLRPLSEGRRHRK